MPEERKKIVVIGAGIAGLRVAQALRKRKDAAVTLVSDQPSFVFLPRLTELFGDSIKEDQAILDLKAVFKGDLLINKANLVNPAEKSVVLDSGKTINYDILVVATGSSVNFFNTPGAQYSYPFYSAQDMRRLREQVDIMLSGDEQKGTHTFAIVGGGPTGVEVAYSLLRYARSKRPGSKVMVVEAGPGIIKVLPEKLQQATLEVLRKEGIEVLADTKVIEITPMAITVQHGESKETIPCYTTIWAAGSKPNKLQINGVEYTPRGEIPVRPTLQSQVDSSIFAVGDCAASGTPKTAQAALQQADVTASNVGDYLAGKQLKPFTYSDKGTIIALDKNTAGLFYGKLLKGFMAQQLRDQYYKLRLREYK